MSYKISRKPDAISIYFFMHIAPCIIDVSRYSYQLSLSITEVPYQWKQALANLSQFTKRVLATCLQIITLFHLHVSISISDSIIVRKSLHYLLS